MIRAALWTNHLSDLLQLADVQKSSRPVKFNFLLLLFPFLQQPPWCRLFSVFMLTYLVIILPLMLLCRMETPFLNLFSLIFFCFFFNFPGPLYDSSPPTANQLSLRSGRVPRHLSSCVSPDPRPPQHRSLSTHAHCGRSSPPILALCLSLPNTQARTHLPTALTSATLLRKGGIKAPAISCSLQ